MNLTNKFFAPPAGGREGRKRQKKRRQMGGASACRETSTRLEKMPAFFRGDTARGSALAALAHLRAEKSFCPGTRPGQNSFQLISPPALGEPLPRALPLAGTSQYPAGHLAFSRGSRLRICLRDQPAAARQGGVPLQGVRGDGRPLGQLGHGVDPAVHPAAEGGIFPVPQPLAAAQAPAPVSTTPSRIPSPSSRFPQG